MSDTAPFGRGRVRRLFGLDRSGPPPRQVRKGEPLNPWTIPNAVGYLRLAALPLFLWLAFESGDGRSAPAAIVFWLIAAGDYLDGFLARVTGQYSRLGSILDPLVDRLTILSGAVVCWNFELLPRWALALLAARELAMLFLAQYGLRHGVEIRVNWPGRISVFPIMGGIFFAMVFAGWVPSALLIVGLGFAIVATVLYAQTGIREVRRAKRAGLARARPFSINLQPSVEPWPDGPIIGRHRPQQGSRPQSRSEMEDTFPDLGSLSDEELKNLIDKLTEEENEISYKRRVLHGKIDILRAELVNRLRQKREQGESLFSGDDVAQLTEILAGKQPSSEDDSAA